MEPAVRRILVTGATGVVGTEVMTRLSSEVNLRMQPVSRRGSDGTISWQMGVQKVPTSLRRSWDVVVNCAASTRWSMTEEEAWTANVSSVAALEELIGPTTLLIHVSTAYADPTSAVDGDRSPSAFRNAYEWSKSVAEDLVLERFKNVTIVRPPLIIGRRSDGAIARFSGIYLILRAVCTGIAPALVASDDAKIDLVPVCDVANVIASAVLLGKGHGSVRWIIGRGANANRFADMAHTMQRSLNVWRSANGTAALPQVPIIRPDRWNRFYLPFATQHLTPRQQDTIRILRYFEPYLAASSEFSITHHVSPLGQTLDKCVEYWAENNRRIASRAPRPWS